MKKKRSLHKGVHAKTAVVAPIQHSTGVSFLALLLLTLYVAAFAVMTFERNKIYQTGITVWESMVRSSPNKRRTHENYGQALSTAGQLHEALREFQTVLSLPDDGSVPLRDVYREIGVVQFRLGSYEEAIRAWQKGLTYAPMDAGLLNNIAIALLKLRRYDEAISHAETAVRNNETMPEPVNTLGEIYLSRGDVNKAARFFKQYLYLRPEDPRGYWNLALTLARSGRYDEAYQYATRYATMNPDVQAQELLKYIGGNIGNVRK